MQDINSEFIIADKMLEAFADKTPKFTERFVSLSKSMQTFLDKSKLSETVRVDPIILGYALFNYFEDIMRLKEFHHVGHINNIKIVSYTSYWLLRMKPLQSVSTDLKTVYINERFVLSYIMNFLENDNCGKILLRTESGLKSFRETLFYFLKYRSINAQSLEMMIIAFFAGQVYQETTEDISASLGKFGFSNTEATTCSNPPQA